jgi:hypothetical protein
MGDLYLNIVESKNRETGGFERQSVVLFADDLPEFLKGFDESLRIMEKAVREKRRSHSGREKERREDSPGGRGERSPGRPKRRSNGEEPGKKPPRLVVKSRKKRED